MIRNISPFIAQCILGLLWCMVALNVYSKPHQNDIKRELAVLSPYKNQIQARFAANQSLVDNIIGQLNHKSLPASLVFLPMLESSFNPKAVSHAGAAGLWQLMPATARRFKLVVNAKQDQRFEIQPSTQAAIQYLNFLYHKFDKNLPLAIAAYNAGEGRVARAIRKAKSNNIQDLKLPKETRQYVSRFYALLELINVKGLQQQDHSYPIFLPSNPYQTPAKPFIDLAPLPPLISL